MKILFTTPVYPYPILPSNESILDANGQRFTHPDEMWVSTSHTHCYANHLLAQNISIPSRILEYPRWKDFKKEVAKNYHYIGISAFAIHLDIVLDMCRYIREHSPGTKIILGSYAALAFSVYDVKETRDKLVDHLVLGDGIHFMRKLLNELPNRPVNQRQMPKGGAAPRFIARYPKGSVAFLVASLGCVGKCDFCSETSMFNYNRMEMLTPGQLVGHMYEYYKKYPGLKQVFVIEEDHFRTPEHLLEIGKQWDKYPGLKKSVDWFTFGSVANIARFGEKYGYEKILELGIACIFIGVESKFAGQHGYDKVEKYEAPAVFAKLHELGIRTLGAWICGWDFHTRENIQEDLNYFISCYPTFQQLSILTPFPGTLFHKRMKNENRVKQVPWKEYSFYGNALIKKSFQEHEPLNMVEYGYKLIYETWGPSALRQMDVFLNGYEYALNSTNEKIKYRLELFMKNAASRWVILKTIYRFAPNGVVRNRAYNLNVRYKELLGGPTPIMRIMAGYSMFKAKRYYKKNKINPYNQYLKNDPFKRYDYKGYNKTFKNNKPYKASFPGFTSFISSIGLKAEVLKFHFLALLLFHIWILTIRRSNKAIDKFLIQSIKYISFTSY